MGDVGRGGLTETVTGCTLGATRWRGGEVIVGYGDEGGSWVIWLGIGLGACALLMWQIAVFSLLSQ